MLTVAVDAVDGVTVVADGSDVAKALPGVVGRAFVFMVAASSAR